MRKRVKAAPPEEALAATWGALPAGAALETVNGDAVRVLHPGRRNREAGPDFLDAVLATPDGEVRGAVEVHRRTSDWERHGHGADPRYGGVVLHVVGRHDGAASRPPGGAQLPLLELGAGLPGTSDSGGGRRFPCAELSTEEAAGALAAAGDARFGAVVARLAVRLAGYSQALGGEQVVQAEQVAYEEIACALGYSRNSESMRTLAAALPRTELQSARADTGGPQVRAEALALGAAGLLPSQRHLPARRRRDAYAEALERAWNAFARPAALRAYRWDAGQVRPENGPVRRVVGLAHLALRWPAEGLLDSVAEAVRRGPPARARRALAALVSVPCPDGYWRAHWDFGVAARGASGGALVEDASNETVALVGPSRTADVVVNVLLPLAAALGERRGDAGLVAAARDIYCSHPPLAENWITRLVRERAGLQSPARTGGDKAVPTARHQQGLISVYEQTCRDLDCERCALGLR